MRNPGDFWCESVTANPSSGRNDSAVEESAPWWRSSFHAKTWLLR